MSFKPKKTMVIVGDPGNTKTESFKRPDHPDFKTSDELKKMEWTGIRQNNIILAWEFWILGRVERSVSFQEVKNDPKALNKAHVEIFHMMPDEDLFKRT